MIYLAILWLQMIIPVSNTMYPMPVAGLSPNPPYFISPELPESNHYGCFNSKMYVQVNPLAKDGILCYKEK